MPPQRVLPQEHNALHRPTVVVRVAFDETLETVCKNRAPCNIGGSLRNRRREWADGTGVLVR